MSILKRAEAGASQLRGDPGAVSAFGPDLDPFDRGRNFAAWLGLVPRQRSTGGKTKLGSVSKMGQCEPLAGCAGGAQAQDDPAPNK